MFCLHSNWPSWQCKMSIAELYVHRNAACPSQCCLSIAMLHVHRNAACPSQCCCFTHLSLLLSLPLSLVRTADSFISALPLGASSSCCCCCCTTDVYTFTSCQVIESSWLMSSDSIFNLLQMCFIDRREKLVSTTTNFAPASVWDLDFKVVFETTLL